ncbi:NADH-ubiquinone oxidoreductase subunit, putative [Ichthyophthirius multifiliis]|uniref:NADH-ubiquinone oxidoreductase subunit, putative n=1 Tax=Ichthyophthirius multifiliis TaxID=5932 RepID=G0R129_ICHMU|nr:NADH-ubiquinone oxidoreductase subunit, putative [Ichthyophthirius multifiliis]EGR28796.1 NADH-ubiquinone oxidoreductase subunit, putative [Ichthyophthirius multifiliis]|eukprot:XP_004030032.1 NADH-ubiquinone oxidoreductase subunit, putative [Ichthyophthirius multifiliis]
MFIKKLSKTLPQQIFKLNVNTPLFYSSGLPSHKINDFNTDSTPFEFTDENYQKIEKILAKYPKKQKRSAVMPLLYLAQEQNNNYVSLSSMKKIAKILEIADMEVYEVASFYTMYNREPVGKFHIQICGTTPCQLCGSREITKAIENYTGTKLGHTSPDMKWTIQEVECLGACVNAPMIQVNNEKVYEDLNTENVVELLKKLENGTAVPGPQVKRNQCEGVMGRTTLKEQSVLHGEIKYTRDFAKAKQDWVAQKELEKAEAEKKKAAAAAQAKK